jgi:hypothetical protein
VLTAFDAAIEQRLGIDVMDSLGEPRGCIALRVSRALDHDNFSRWITLGAAFVAGILGGGRSHDAKERVDGGRNVTPRPRCCMT